MMIDVEVARLFAKALVIMSMWGSAIGEAYLIAKALECMARNPDIGDTLFTRMIIGAAIVESIAIYAFVAFFLI